MINFIEKGRGLILAVKAAGHRVWHQDRVCYSTNDEAVQAIIDLVMEGLEAEYPEVEKRTFTKQEAEARAFIIDSNANTPTLSPIALARGISLIDLVTKTLVKADLYTAQVGALIGQRQYKEDLIDAEADWLAVEGINL